jgi:hypothetical protein
LNELQQNQWLQPCSIKHFFKGNAKPSASLEIFTCSSRSRTLSDRFKDALAATASAGNLQECLEQSNIMGSS